jgi:TPR repeat protein
MEFWCKKMKKWVADWVLFACLSAPGLLFAADPLEDGVKAVEQEDYMSAYQLFKGLAEQGNAEAQYNLAILYRQGKGVMQDQELALQWFQKAAKQGLASAEYYLGHLYDTGDSVNKDAAVAFDWYKKAAEKGNPLAQSNLGVAYANGEGVGQDIIKAYVWFSLSASQGLTAALENRNVLKKEMSEELQANARRLTTEYFNKYVAPFQPQSKKLTSGGHQGVTDPHQSINKPMPHVDSGMEDHGKHK